MILNVQGLQFHYPNHPVLDDAGFMVEPGTLLAILGTNGTGKSTLLKCINRILKPAGGLVYIGEQPVDGLNRSELARTFGYVEQQRAGTRSTVFNAVLLGRKPYVRWDIGKHDLEIAEQALATLGLSDYAMRYLDELSGGELQKVMLARALAQEPRVMLLDEPTSSLDMKNQLEVLHIIRAITRSRNIAALVAMHDLNLALRFADRFLLLKDRRIYAAGGVEIMTPENIEAVYAVPVSIALHGEHRVVIPR